MKQKINQKPRSFVMHGLALVLVLSGVLRLGEQANAATTEQQMAQDTNPVARSDRILGMPLDNQSLPALLEAFKEREERLLIAEEEAMQREAKLIESENAIQTQLDQLMIAEERLAATLAKTDVAAIEDLKRLAEVYENMKAQDTAALFSEMEPGFAAGFLGLMRPEAAAAIMTQLEPNTAYLISVMLAGRNANAPTRE